MPLVEYYVDEEGGVHEYDPKIHGSSRNWKPLIAAIIVIIAVVFVYLWMKHESRFKTLHAVHSKIFVFESEYVSSLNESDGINGYDSFDSQAELFVKKIDNLLYKSGYDTSHIPEKYSKSIVDLKASLKSVRESAQQKQLNKLESLVKSRNKLRSDFNEIAKMNGLDLSGLQSIPAMTLIGKIKKYEEDLVLASELKAERELAAIEEREREEEALQRALQDLEDALRSPELRALMELEGGEQVAGRLSLLLQRVLERRLRSTGRSINGLAHMSLSQIASAARNVQSDLLRVEVSMRRMRKFISVHNSMEAAERNYIFYSKAAFTTTDWSSIKNTLVGSMKVYRSAINKAIASGACPDSYINNLKKEREALRDAEFAISNDDIARFRRAFEQRIIFAEETQRIFESFTK